MAIINQENDGSKEGFDGKIQSSSKKRKKKSLITKFSCIYQSRTNSTRKFWIVYGD